MEQRRWIKHWINASIGMIAGPLMGLTIDFEDIIIGADSFLNNAPGGEWQSGGSTLPNSFTDWGGGFTSWSGYAISSRSGSVISGGDLAAQNFLPYQYQVPAGVASSGSNFAIAYVSAFGSTRIQLPSGMDAVLSLDVTNSLYTWASMTYGDFFSKKFGGPDGLDPDYFKLTIKGFDQADLEVGTVEFYLADFRDPLNQFIVAEWTTVNLTTLGSGLASLDFTLESTDNGMFGMNTPSLIALDNLAVIPEPSAWWLLGLFALGVAVVKRRD